MLRRLVLAAGIGCATLALGVSAAAESAEARAFTAKTSQGYEIKVAMRDGALRLVRFDIRLRCNDGTREILAESGFLWTPLRRGGAFRDAQFGKKDSVYFRGRAGQRAVRGKVRVLDRPEVGVRCKSPLVRFAVRLR